MELAARHDESDEAFARRLQEQEMGTPHAQTPLVNRPVNVNNHNLPNQNQNPTIINARFNELSTARATVGAIVLMSAPQIIAAIIILSQHWNDFGICDSMHTARWKWWSAMSAFRMFAFCVIISTMHGFKSWFDQHPRYLQQATSIRNLVDGMGLVWFVIGNMWLFGDDDRSCRHPERSPIYGLCVAMLAINYIQICLPCIIAILLIPIFCFCMPCLIRVLARLQSARANVGATDDTIAAIPLVHFGDADLENLGDNRTCPICLNEFALEEDARILPCKHTFHQQCVDEWLRVNASCPTCRQSMHTAPGGDGTGGGSGSSSASTALVGGAAAAAGGGGGASGISVVGGGGAGGAVTGARLGSVDGVGSSLMHGNSSSASTGILIDLDSVVSPVSSGSFYSSSSGERTLSSRRGGGSSSRQSLLSADSDSDTHEL